MTPTLKVDDLRFRRHDLPRRRPGHSSCPWRRRRALVVRAPRRTAPAREARGVQSEEKGAMGCTRRCREGGPSPCRAPSRSSSPARIPVPRRSTAAPRKRANVPLRLELGDPPAPDRASQGGRRTFVAGTRSTVGVWLRRRVAALAPQSGSNPRREVRETWVPLGSCSRRGTVNFNWDHGPTSPSVVGTTWSSRTSHLRERRPHTVESRGDGARCDHEREGVGSLSTDMAFASL